MSSVGIQDIVGQLQTLVGNGLPISFGKQAKSLNVSPPFVWVHPISERFAVPQGPGYATNPRTLKTRIVDCELHCWGSTYLQAEQIQAAMVTAMQQAMNGANYMLGDGEWREGLNEDLGQLLIVRVAFVMALPQATLPFAGTDANQPTVTVTDDAPDTTGLSPNTGTPYWGETQ